MEALVCDICGGKLSMGTGGIAVCESCGMEHTKERIQEKVQEIKGVVRVDNSHMIQNYLCMAQNAYDSSNQAEAESYCNKIIEIDPNNYQAWLLKGKSAGWQSKLSNIRILESVSAFCKAIKCGPENKKDKLIEDAKNEITKLGQAIIRLRFDGLSICLDDHTSNEFISEIEQTKNAIEKFICDTDENISLYEMIEPVVNYANQAIKNLYIEIFSNYLMEEFPDITNWQSFVNWTYYCIPILKKLVALCEISCDYDKGIRISENIVRISKEAVNSICWYKEYVYLGPADSLEKMCNASDLRRRGFGVDEEKNLVYKPRYMSDTSKKKFSQIIDDYEKILEKFENDRNTKAEKRLIEYWEAHADEKQSLEAEKQSLSVQIKELSDEISRIPEQAELSNLNSRYTQLSGEKAALGMFKNKEKKAVQEQMDAVNTDISKVKSRLDATLSEIMERITPLETRARAIETELTKDR